MSKQQRVVLLPEGVAGLEQVGRDLHSSSLPLLAHSHTGIEICYLAKGQVTWIVGSKKLRLVGGTFSVVGPEVSHRGEFDVIAPGDLCWAVLDPRQLLPGLDAGLLELLLTPDAWTAPASVAVEVLFHRLLRECREEQTGWRSGAGACLTSLVLECARLAPVSGREQATRTSRTILEAAEIISADLEHPPSIAMLAAEVGLGLTRFHQLFKGVIGMTPHDYLLRQRLAAARIALGNNRESITRLAIRLGFSSSQHFATVFRKHNGMTPSAYRKKARKKQVYSGVDPGH
jgi:AraC-like DNA-binding protein